ncbi:hypothetical protein PT2222_10477 [Paraburkholderia tropica]
MKHPRACGARVRRLHAEVFAEVDAANAFVFDDVTGRAGGEHGAVADDVRVVADAERLAHVVVRDQHADVALLQELHDFLDFEHGDRVDARERFVEQNEARIGRQRARDFHAAAFAARQRQRRILAQVRDLEFVEQRFGALRDHVLAQTLAVLVVLQLQHRADVLLDGELAEHRGFLRQIREAQRRALVDRQQTDGLAVEVDFARVERHEADDHVERRGLARAVRTEQTDHFAALHVERHVFHDRARAVALLEVAHDERARLARGRTLMDGGVGGGGVHCCGAP